LGEVKHNKKRAFGKYGEINENSLISQALTALIVSGSLVKRLFFADGVVAHVSQWVIWQTFPEFLFFVTQWSKPGNI
jgi:hypothetical protein